MNQRTKDILRVVFKLISILAVFGGMGLTILTAAGIEQDVLTDKQWIVWSAISIGLMTAGGIISTYTGRRGEEDGYDNL